MSFVVDRSFRVRGCPISPNPINPHPHPRPDHHPDVPLGDWDEAHNFPLDPAAPLAGAVEDVDPAVLADVVSVHLGDEHWFSETQVVKGTPTSIPFAEGVFKV